MCRDNRGTVGFVVRVTSRTLGERESAEFMAAVRAFMILGVDETGSLRGLLMVFGRSRSNNFAGSISFLMSLSEMVVCTGLARFFPGGWRGSSA